jgi:hypothetical protein
MLWINMAKNLNFPTSFSEVSHNDIQEYLDNFCGIYGKVHSWSYVIQMIYLWQTNMPDIRNYQNNFSGLIYQISTKSVIRLMGYTWKTIYNFI